MERQAERGWYDVGDGLAGMWDGQQWTGERISHEQLAALTRPAAPPPPTVPSAPAARPVGPPPQRRWAIAGAVGAVAMVALIIAGAMVDDGADSGRRRTTTTAVDVAAVFRDTANTLAKVCDSADSSRNGMTIAVATGDEECQQLVGLSLGMIGFTSADYAKALGGNPVLSEGGGAELTVIRAADGELVTVRKVA